MPTNLPTEQTVADVKSMPAAPASATPATITLLETPTSKFIDAADKQVQDKIDQENDRAAYELLNDQLLPCVSDLICPDCQQLSSMDCYVRLNCDDIVCYSCFIKSHENEKEKAFQKGIFGLTADLVKAAKIEYFTDNAATADTKADAKIVGSSLGLSYSELEKDRTELQAIIQQCNAIKLDEKAVDRNFAAIHFGNQVVTYAEQIAAMKDNPYYAHANLLKVFSAISLKTREKDQGNIEYVLKQFQLLFLNKSFATAEKGFEFFAQQIHLLKIMAEIVLFQLTEDIAAILSGAKSSSQAANIALPTTITEIQTTRELIEYLQIELNKQPEEANSNIQFKKFLDLVANVEAFLAAAKIDKATQAAEYRAKFVFTKFVMDYKKRDLPLLKEREALMTQLNEVFYNREEMGGDDAFKIFSAVENTNLLKALAEFCLKTIQFQTRLPLPLLAIAQTAESRAKCLAELQKIAAQTLNGKIHTLRYNELNASNIYFSFETALARTFIEMLKKNFPQDAYEVREVSSSPIIIFVKCKPSKTTADQEQVVNSKHYCIKKQVGKEFEIVEQPLTPEMAAAATAAPVAALTPKF